MKRLTERLKVIGKKLPKALLLAFFLLGALLLDAVAYGFFNTCKACTSYSQFLTTPQAVSNQIILSLSALFSLTERKK